MKLNLIAILMLFTMIPAAGAASVVEERIPRDARIVRDTAELRLRRISADSLWAIARVTPTPTSGQMIAQGAYLQEGKVITPPGSRFVVPIEGVVRQLSRLAGPGDQQKWTYAWEFSEGQRTGEDAAVFSPFRSGGVVILRIDSDADGAAKFPDVILIPDDWAAPIREALETWQDSALSVRQPGSERESELRLLLEGTNPLLSVMAFRTLLEARAMEEHEARAALLAQKGLRQAMLAYLILNRSPEISALDGFAVLFGALTDASLTDLPGLAIGGLAALNEAQSTSGRQAVRAVLHEIDRRRAELEEDDEVSRYLREIATAAGLQVRQ